MVVLGSESGSILAHSDDLLLNLDGTDIGPSNWGIVSHVPVSYVLMREPLVDSGTYLDVDRLMWDTCTCSFVLVSGITSTCQQEIQTLSSSDSTTPAPSL